MKRTELSEPMHSNSMPNVRVVVRLPYNRPEHPLEDPPHVEWNSEKADILWKVIERSRMSDNGGTDWKGLAAHLEVPLPYLLYRVHARYQEDLRGLQDIPGVSSPSALHPPNAPFENFPVSEPQSVAGRAITAKQRLSGSSRLSSSSRQSTLGIRARLNSLGHNSSSLRPKKASSSSTLTLQGPKKPAPHLSSTASSSEEESDSEDEEMLKEEEAERYAEEQEALDRKLQDLQKMITSGALGLVRDGKRRGKSVDRGRMGMISPNSMNGSFRQDMLSSRSASQSVSSADSPQGSLPEIPSPPPDSLPHSPMSRHMSPSKSSSPPALSPRSALSHSHRRYEHLVGRSNSEQGSNHGSEASSFSDISDTDLSASALDSALLSKMPGNSSRFSGFTPRQYGLRSHLPR